MGLVNSAPRALAPDVYQARWPLDGEDLVVIRKTERQFRLEYPVGKVLHALKDPRSLSGANREGLIGLVDFTDDRQSWFILIDASGRERKRRLLTKSAGALDQRTFWSPDQTEIWSAAFEHGESRGTVIAYGVTGSRRVLARLPEPVELCGVARTAGTLLRLTYEERRPFAKAPGADEARPLQVDADPVALTADGRYLALQSKWEQDQLPSIWFQDLEAGGPPVLLGRGGILGISPDGKWIGVIRPPHTCSLMPVGAGPEENLEIPGIERPSLIGWRPEGKLLVTGVSSDNQRFRTLNIWARGSSTVQHLSTPIEKGQTPMGISPDGQQILLYNPGENLSFIQNVSGGIRTPLNGLKPGEYVIGWAAESGSLYIASGEASNVLVETYHVETRRRTPWKTLSSGRPDMAITWIQIAPAGRAWAYTTLRSSSRLVITDDLK